MDANYLFSVWIVIFTFLNVLLRAESTPILLVNKGEINIHDSVQRVGHVTAKSNGGRLRFFGLSPSPAIIEDSVYSARQSRANTEIKPFSPSYQLSNYQSISNNISPTQLSQNNNMEQLLSQSSFTPSKEFQNYANGGSTNKIRPPFEQEKVEYSKNIVPGTNTITNNIFPHDTQIHSTQHPSRIYQGAEPLGLKGQNKKNIPAKKGLRRLMSGIQEKVMNSFHHMKDALKTMTMRRRMRGPSENKYKRNGFMQRLRNRHQRMRNLNQQQQVQNRSENETNSYTNNKRSSFLGLDYWSLDSQLGRLFRTFNLSSIRNKDKSNI